MEYMYKSHCFLKKYFAGLSKVSWVAACGWFLSEQKEFVFNLIKRKFFDTSVYESVI